MTAPAITRPMEATDARLVVDSWWKSHAKATRSKRTMAHRSAILEVLERPESRGLVVAAEADPRHVLGWLVYAVVGDIVVVHWCYTKRPYRRFGVCKRLLAAAGIGPGVPVIFTGAGRFAELLVQQHSGPAEEVPLERYLDDARSTAA